MKKGGPLAAVLVLLLLFVGLIFAAQSLMPFAIVNRFIQEFNTAGFSSLLRSDNILDLQLSTSSGTFGMTEYQLSSLEENGIYNVSFGGGTVLSYPGNGGEFYLVVGTSQNMANVNDVSGLFVSKYPTVFSTQTRWASSAKKTPSEALEDSKFKNPYTTASRTWRNGNSGWFDTLTSMNESIRGLTRSRYFGTATRRITKIEHSLAKNLMKARTSGALTKESVSSGSETTTGSSGTGLMTAATLTEAAAAASGAVCAIISVVNQAQTMVNAYARYQQMNLATGYLESVQMVQAGDSDGAVMNEYNNNLMQNDSSGGNAMTSSGMSALMTGTTIDNEDSSVLSVNSEGSISNILTDIQSDSSIMNLLKDEAGNVGSLVKQLTACTYIKGALNIVSSVLSGIEVAVSIATLGVGKVVTTIIKFIGKAAISATVGAIVSLVANRVVDYVLEHFKDTFLKDMATEWLGQDLGNALVSGGHSYLSSNSQTGGGSPAGKAQTVSYFRTQQTVLAQEAKYYQETLSPVDVSNQYTFLGSIVYSLIPLATTSTTSSVLKNMSSLVSNSLTSILPSASALEETNLISSFGDCPLLESVGMAGDAYCNPYIITDTSTITSTRTSTVGAFDNPEYIIEYLKGTGAGGTWQIKEKGKNDRGVMEYEINPNGYLHKYIVYCGARTSSFGLADAEVAAKIQEKANDVWWRKIPILGGLIGGIADIINAGNDKDWISGQKCGDTDAENNGCFWESEGKYYQRFIEDQRLLANIGAIDQDAASVALMEYYEENPLDNTFEGILARYSGMTKDDVIATLDFLEAYDYIANVYRPSDRSVSVAMLPETDDSIYFENTTDVSSPVLAVEPKYIVYATLRNKTVLV